jgi:uncharacterized protein (DUF58 family)
MASAITDSALTYDIHSAREVLRRLELTITRKLDGLLQGDYRGLVPGHGSEPGETRAYVPGDDVRRIDWNVTARTQQPHVRVTIADRELETWVLIDQSPSLDFGTTRMEKRDLALAATAAVGFLTAKIGNRLGAVIVDGHSITQLPARQGRTHLMGILHRVQQAPRRGAVEDSDPDHRPHADLAAGIRRMAGPGHRRGLAVVVSDLLGPQSWQNELRRLSLLHDTLVVEVIDPRELELPDVGLLTLVDPESGRIREVNTRDRKLRQRYADAARAQREQNERSVRECGADHLVLRTDTDWLLDIVRFVALRRKRLEVTPAR